VHLYNPQYPSCDITVVDSLVSIYLPTCPRECSGASVHAVFFHRSESCARFKSKRDFFRSNCFPLPRSLSLSFSLPLCRTSSRIARTHNENVISEFGDFFGILPPHLPAQRDATLCGAPGRDRERERERDGKGRILNEAFRFFNCLGKSIAIIIDFIIDALVCQCILSAIYMRACTTSYFFACMHGQRKAAEGCRKGEFSGRIYPSVGNNRQTNS